MNLRQEAQTLYDSMKLQHWSKGVILFAVVWSPRTKNAPPRFEAMASDALESRKWLRDEPWRRVGTYTYHDVTLSQLMAEIDAWRLKEGKQE